MSEDPLDDIFVDKNEPLDKKLVSDILKGLVTIDSEGIVRLTDDGEKLTDGQKVLAYLVCRKAMAARGIIKEENEAIGATEISKNIGVGIETAKKATNTTFKNLLTNKNSKYAVMNHSLRKIITILKKNT